MKILETINVWEKLKKETRPLLMYGMGVGAEKILGVLSRFNIPVEAIFTSDNVQRERTFMGIQVFTYEQAVQKYGDFAIVLAFANSRKEMLEKMFELKAKHPLYLPDVPICGDELFTYEYYLRNKDRFEEAYSLLSDELSKNVFEATINYKISGNIDYLKDISTTPKEAYETIIKPSDHEYFYDLGAYDGDTICEFLKYTNGNYAKIVAMEPDIRNFKKLARRLYGMNMDHYELYNMGAWCEREYLSFATKGGRNSKLSSAEKNNVLVNSVDTIVKDKPISILKMDIEGAEFNALCGAYNTIIKQKPKLLISAYHRNEDHFLFPILFQKMNPDYKIYLRHFPYVPAWENNYFAV